MTAMTAPDWMTTLNRSDWWGSQCSTIRRGPVEETGRNSVIPSIMPKIMMLMKSGIRCLEGKFAPVTSRKLASCCLCLEMYGCSIEPSEKRTRKMEAARKKPCKTLLPEENRNWSWVRTHLGNLSFRKSTNEIHRSNSLHPFCAVGHFWFLPNCPRDGPDFYQPP